MGGTGKWPEHFPHHLGKLSGVRRGGIGVMGALSESVILSIVEEHSPSIQKCYEQGLRLNPSLSGVAMLRFLVSPNGKVKRVNTMGSGLTSRTTLRCLEQVFQALRFPTPDSGSVRVTLPLQFKQ